MIVIEALAHRSMRDINNFRGEKNIMSVDFQIVNVIDVNS